MAADIEGRISPCVEFEVRDKYGNLKSSGKQFVDKHGHTHFVRRDSRGKTIGEIVVDKTGKVLKSVEGDSPLSYQINNIANKLRLKSS
jgi:hypothetical protein